jgi:hypothetical protein
MRYPQKEKKNSFGLNGAPAISVCGSGFLLYAVNIDMFFYKPGISLFLGTKSI